MDRTSLKIVPVMEHLEVYDADNNFLFSEDNITAVNDEINRTLMN